MPLVSVVMAVYNGASELSATLESVLGQRGCDFECIVVNDGSSDGSAELLDQMARCHDRLRVVHQENQGLTRSLVRGCAMARGSLIARQDCADLSYPGRLARLSEFLLVRPELAMVASAYRHVGPCGELLGCVGPQHNDEELRRVLLAGDPATLYGPHHGTVMFRASAYRAAGGYRPQFYFAQDLDLWTRLASQGGIAILADELYEVRFTRGSITARHTPRQQRLRELIAQATRARAKGESEIDLLDAAAKVRPENADQSSVDEADIDYFLGSSLASRGDPAARGYLLKVVRRRPLMARAWIKLLLSGLRGFRVGR